jgi:hypothetical protein
LRVRNAKREAGPGHVAATDTLHEPPLVLGRGDLEVQALRILRHRERLRAHAADDAIRVVVDQGDQVAALSQRSGHGLRRDAFAEAAQILGEGVDADGIADELRRPRVGGVRPEAVQVPDFQVISHSDR